MSEGLVKRGKVHATNVACQEKQHVRGSDVLPKSAPNHSPYLVSPSLQPLCNSIVCAADYILTKDAQYLECEEGDCTEEQCCVKIMEVLAASESDSRSNSRSEESCECSVLHSCW